MENAEEKGENGAGVDAVLLVSDGGAGWRYISASGNCKRRGNMRKVRGVRCDREVKR